MPFNVFLHFGLSRQKKSLPPMDDGSDDFIKEIA